MSNTILITGGTGMIGTALTTMLISNGNKVIILTRDPGKARQQNRFGNSVSYAHWDLEKQDIDTDAIKNSDAIINLAGAGVVDKPWTKQYKNEILESRTHSSALLVKGLRSIPNRVKVVINQSAIGFYGQDTKKGHAFTEGEPPAPGFLGDTCAAWENSIRPVEELGKRLVIFRTGIVLSKKGGALAEFKKPLQLRVAAILSNGSQVVSWVHLEDLCRMFAYAISNPSMQGVYNAVAPTPVTNKALTLQLARTMHGNQFISMHVPAFVLKIMMGDRSMEVLKSATVSAGKILDAGFQFGYPELGEALEDLVKE